MRFTYIRGVQFIPSLAEQGPPHSRAAPLFAYLKLPIPTTSQLAAKQDSVVTFLVVVDFRYVFDLESRR